MASSSPPAARHEWVPEPLTRDGCVEGLSRQFAEELDWCIEEVVADSDGLTQEQIDSVKSRFQAEFDSFIGVGFDIAYRKKFFGGGGDDDADGAAAMADMTVTEDDLLRVDRGLDRVARMRKKYPPQLTQFLDKALLHQADAAMHAKADVARAELPSAPPNDETSGKQILLKNSEFLITLEPPETSAEPDLGRIMGGGEETEKADVDSAVRLELERLDDDMRRSDDIETAARALTRLAQLSE